MIEHIQIPLLLSFIAGTSTVLGSFIVFFLGDFKKSYLSFFLGISAGVMIYLSFIELLPESVKIIGFLNANLAFFGGIIGIGIIDYIVPHHYMNYCAKNGITYNKLALTGAMVVIGLMIHNFPEGIAVFMSSLANVKIGILIAVATALHNIPEGVAVAIPVFYATKSKKKALYYTLLSAIAEPMGAILAFFILQPFITTELLSYIFAIVAGIMIYISLDELLPSCFGNGRGHTAIFGIMTGMLLMATVLQFV